jgi:hypothetical protein
MTARSFVCCLIPMSNVTEFDADLRNTFMIGVATAGRGADTAQAGGGPDGAKANAPLSAMAGA